MALASHYDNRNIFTDHCVRPVIKCSFDPIPWLLRPACLAYIPARKRWKLFVVKILLYLPSGFKESIISLENSIFWYVFTERFSWTVCSRGIPFQQRNFASLPLLEDLHLDLVHQKNNCWWCINSGLFPIEVNRFINAACK